MRILCVFGRHNYGNPARGEGVEYSQFLPALRSLGHDVDHFESLSRATYRNFAELNRALLERVEKWRPDIVFTVLLMAEVWIDTIRLIRATGVRVVNWSTDDSWKYREFSRLIAAEFDAFATTCPEAREWYARDGISSCLTTQWAVPASSLAPPKPASQCAFDVSFVGTRYGEREALVARLRDAGIDVKCFGHGWPDGPVEASRVREIFRDSRISLNFSEGGGGAGLQIKARNFEVPGSGGLLVTERVEGLERYFELGHEIEVFEDGADLIRVVARLLRNPGERDAIAARGHARTVADHTYERRFTELFAAGALQPTRNRDEIDWDSFELAAARHRSGPGLRAVRSVLAGCASLVWGTVRGPRAARRALFETCWRVFGRHTYTSAGFPGRLFYNES